MKAKCYCQRTNPFKVTAIVAALKCACCGRSVWWFNTVKILECENKQYAKHQNKQQRICGSCCDRAGVKHVTDSAWFKLRDDVDW